MGRHIYNVLAHYEIKDEAEGKAGEARAAEGEEKGKDETFKISEGTARTSAAIEAGTERGVGFVANQPPRSEIKARKSGAYAALKAAGKRGLTVQGIIAYLTKIGFPVNSPYYAKRLSNNAPRLEVAIRNDLYRWKITGRVTVVDRSTWRLTEKG